MNARSPEVIVVPAMPGAPGRSAWAGPAGRLAEEAYQWCRPPSSHRELSWHRRVQQALSQCSVDARAAVCRGRQPDQHRWGHLRCQRRAARIVKTPRGRMLAGIWPSGSATQTSAWIPHRRLRPSGSPSMMALYALMVGFGWGRTPLGWPSAMGSVRSSWPPSSMSTLGRCLRRMSPHFPPLLRRRRSPPATG